MQSQKASASGLEAAHNTRQLLSSYTIPCFSKHMLTPIVFGFEGLTSSSAEVTRSGQEFAQLWQQFKQLSCNQLEVCATSGRFQPPL